MADKQQFVNDMKKVFDCAKDTSDEKKLFTHNGVLYPSSLCSVETFAALECFEAKEDDIVLVAYPKCGTTWSLELLRNMVQAVYNKEPPPIIPIIEFGAPDKFEKLKQEVSPRVIGTHMHYEDLPKSFFDKKTKMLVVFRNPKDTAVSFFHFYNKNPLLPNYSSWDTFFQDFMSGNVCWGSYFDHAVAWNKHIDDNDVLIMTFEEMKEDLKEAVKKISEFFGFSMTEEQVQKVTDKGTFKSMKEKYEELPGDFAKIFFRKGDVGDWKNHLSEAQSQEIDAKFEECLAGTKLGEMLKYNKYCK
ncbi:sulfotransferase 6B1-like [Rhinophrynus dorsalis]